MTPRSENFRVSEGSHNLEDGSAGLAPRQLTLDGSSDIAAHAV